jgi:hypothetical protein
MIFPMFFELKKMSEYCVPDVNSYGCTSDTGEILRKQYRLLHHWDHYHMLGNALWVTPSLGMLWKY